tara:strand:- start:593 stop:1135 length:543 start_codon:yes stop_codon:yes gene_type:complete
MCVHPDDLEAYQAHLDEVIKGGRQSRYDFKYQRKDGVTIWCRSVKCVFERDGAGNVLSYIGVIIEFKETVPPEAKDIIMETDGHRFQQVLINLLSNALKFSDEGVIEFGYRQLGDSVEFFVQYQGIGISEDRMEVIFERFEHFEHLEDKAKYLKQGFCDYISKPINAKVLKEKLTQLQPK